MNAKIKKIIWLLIGTLFLLGWLEYQDGGLSGLVSMAISVALALPFIFVLTWWVNK